MNGPGQFPKPATDAVNADTSDWAHEYSFWGASAVWQAYLQSGDRAFAIAQEPALIRQYQGWANHFDATLGLYWQVPVWDATEYSASSLESTDPYHGGAGYRPTINAYQYGDANAIAAIATLNGDATTASTYKALASALKASQQKYLWDATRTFFYDMPRDGNAGNTLLDAREEMGFVPWMFDMPDAADAVQFAQLLDPQGFAAAYGPTTIERRSTTWFMYQASTCCHWDGPSWPYETSQTLTGLANLLHDYPPQSVISAADYLSLLHTYAATQYKNGAPYVAEAHDPDNGDWIYDTANHSEDYNHSTFDDNVLAGLFGLRGQPDDTLAVSPLAPATWDYFAVENALYHGHELTVLWDRTGARNAQGAGLHVYVDGVQVAAQAGLGALTVNVGPAIVQSSVTGGIDVAANGQRHTDGPQPFASYTSSAPGVADSVWNVVDGVVYRAGIPEEFALDVVRDDEHQRLLGYRLPAKRDGRLRGARALRRRRRGANAGELRPAVLGQRRLGERPRSNAHPGAPRGKRHQRSGLSAGDDEPAPRRRAERRRGGRLGAQRASSQEQADLPHRQRQQRAPPRRAGGVAERRRGGAAVPGHRYGGSLVGAHPRGGRLLRDRERQQRPRPLDERGYHRQRADRSSRR